MSYGVDQETGFEFKKAALEEHVERVTRDPGPTWRAPRAECDMCNAAIAGGLWPGLDTQGRPTERRA